MIADAVTKYLAELSESGLGTAPHRARESALEDFQASCRKTFVDEIVREDIILYVSWMKQNLIQIDFRRPNISLRGRLILLNTLLGQSRKGERPLAKRMAGDCKDETHRLHETEVGSNNGSHDHREKVIPMN